MKSEIKKYLYKFIILSSIIFLFVYLFTVILKLDLFSNSASLFYQYDHIQLGNLLVLPFIILFPQTFSWLFFISILFSYSRTAYIALMVGIINNKNKTLKYFTILISVIFLFVISNNYFFTKNKKSFGYRNFYFSYAVSSIKEKPWLGVGPGNFYFAASKRQNFYNENTTTAHNIILDLLAENGLFAGLFFLFFLVSGLIRAKKDKHFYLLLSLTLVFLFDFSYRYNSFLILWFLILGLVNKESQSIVIYTKPLLLFLLILQIVFLKQIYFFRNHLDPEKNFIAANQKAIRDEQLGNEKSALYFYKKTLELYPFKDVSNNNIIGKILDFNIEVYGRYLGRKKTAIFIDKLIKDINYNNKSPIFSHLKAYCLDNALRCYNIRN